MVPGMSAYASAGVPQPMLGVAAPGGQLTGSNGSWPLKTPRLEMAFGLFLLTASLRFLASLVW